MTIVYRLLPDGGFVCGDTETRVTSYAYPTSNHANQAKDTPNVVAWAMIHKESATARTAQIIADYDARHWALLP